MVAKDDTETPNPRRRVGVVDAGHGLPATMTTAQILREVDRLREIQDERLTSAIQTITAELKGMATALELTQTYPTMLDKTVADLKEQHVAAINSLRELHEEKFSSIKEQIKTLARAAEKSEASSIKLTDQLGGTIGASAKALTLLEGTSRGGASTWGYIIAGIGAVVGLIGIFGFLSNQSPEPSVIYVPTPEAVVVTPPVR